MVTALKFTRCLLSAGLLIITGATVAQNAQAQNEAAVSPAAQNGMVEWVQQPEPTHLKQTDAQEKHGLQFGRPLPKPEVLQPGLDPGLDPYVPLENRKLAGHFKGAASDVMADMSKRWVDAFQKLYPNVHIEIPPPYAGSLGTKELIKGDLDFVFVSRELKPDDISGFQAKFEYPPFTIPVSGGSYRQFGFLDAVVFVVNKTNPIEKISFDQLDRLLSTTHVRGGEAIRTWGDLGLSGDWADKPIHVYGIQPWNGFEEFVRQRVLSVGNHRGEWRTDLHFSKVVFPIAGQVAADPYGIGYTGAAFVDAPVKVLALQTASDQPVYAPTYENVARAVYPLSRLIYFNTNKRPGEPLNPVLQEFLKFILSRDGQQLVLQQGIYLPLRKEQVENARELLNRK
jgi:phosphate transport system substrate-binding protein